MRFLAPPEITVIDIERVPAGVPPGGFHLIPAGISTKQEEFSTRRPG